MSFTDKFTSVYKRILPSPFTIALLLTILTFILALIFTKPEGLTYGSYTLELAGSWEASLWKEGSGGLYFAFQMMLMLILGHIMALSKPVSKLIDIIIVPCTNTAKTAFVVALATIALSLFNWGLGLIFGAILARKIGEKFSKEKRSLNYGLIGAAAYSGLMVWHGGISGSAPIKAAEEGSIPKLVEGMEGIDISTLPSNVDFSETIFSSMNIVVALMLLTLIPTMMYFIGKKKKGSAKLPEAILVKEDVIIEATGAERLDHSKIFGILIGSLILFYAFYKAFVLPKDISLSVITPNFINFVLLGLGIAMHTRISKFIEAANSAISGATGILIQFPFYFGILGIMTASGLIGDISDAFVNYSTENTFPIFTFFSAGLVNVFVPSGGGQWAVQGPIIISAVQELGLSYPKAIMALAYGDQLTNMIQPFWALPLLGITGLKAKEILPYTLMLFLAGGVIFMLGLILF